MPKYWVKNYFAHGRFPEVGQKQKTEKKREKKRERERPNDGNNNGQCTHGARKPPGPTWLWAFMRAIFWSNIPSSVTWRQPTAVQATLKDCQGAIQIIY